jgi:hypothetical protein
MAGIPYEVHVGSAKASNGTQGDLVVLSLWTELTMDGAGGRCAVELAMTSATPPKPGDAVTVSLGDDGGSKPVFTGEAQRVAISPTTVTVHGVDGISRLASLEVETAYEKTAAGTIAKELIQKAGLTAGKVDDGPKLPSYVLHREPKALRHLQRLAEACGCDLYTDGDGKVHFARPKAGGADHTFVYGEQVLDLAFEAGAPAHDGVVVWGEGAGSTKGEDKNHWLVGDLSSVSGKASIDAKFTVKPGSAGKSPLTVKDGATRAGADAADQAKARMAWLAARPVRGSLSVLGNPAVKPGDLVKIDKLPQSHAASALVSGKVLRVRRVRHALGTKQGFITRMGF